MPAHVTIYSSGESGDPWMLLPQAVGGEFSHPVSVWREVQTSGFTSDLGEREQH